jgi:NAD(P)-dependent dehydrogenase (short-subunit alcohol dehydrogenase family)
MAFFDLTGKVAFITGTSRGLGQYFARALAQAGADIAMSSRDASKLGPFRKEIEALGRRTCGVDLDVRDHDSIKAAVASVEKQMGRIDILVNNAGCNARKPALEVTWEDWNMVLDTNLRGTFFTSQAVAPGMIGRGYGRIVNIVSVTCVAGYAGLAP